MTGKEYRQNVEKHLINVHGAVNPAWNGLLDSLEADFDQLMLCDYELKNNGLVIQNVNGKGCHASPYINIKATINSCLCKTIAALGISPKSASNIKTQSVDDDEDFFENLRK